MSLSSNSQSPSAGDLEIRKLLLQYRLTNWHRIQPVELQEQLVDIYLSGDWTEPLKRIAPYVNLSASTRILDLGCGVGSFVVACRKRGLQCFGLEPDRIGNGVELNAIQIARRRWALPVFLAGTGENLPFPDNTFDLITMNQVIEHVSDQKSVLREAARVLRPGGVIYVACPNYLRFYEPHYKMFWFPLMPKALAELYLRLRNRSSVMIHQITYTTNRRVRLLLQALGPNYKAIDLHRQQFLKKRDEGCFAAPSTRIVNRLTRLPVVGSLILALTLWFGSVRQGGCEWVLIKSRIPAK